MRYLLSVIAVLLLTGTSLAGFEWRRHADPTDPNLYLFQDSVQIGGWDVTRGQYRPYSALTQTWGTPCPPPVSVPGLPLTNLGVDSGRISSTERITLNGQDISMDQALRIIRDSTIPQDESFLRITIIGQDAQRAQVRTDLSASPALAFLAGRVLVQDYPPTHWAVQCGFVTTGSPTIYIQSPNGRVLHRQDAYSGPENLAEAIRRVDPAYQPAQDPNVTSPFSLPQLPEWAWYAMIGGAVLWVLLKK